MDLTTLLLITLKSAAENAVWRTLEDTVVHLDVGPGERVRGVFMTLHPEVDFKAFDINTLRLNKEEKSDG